MSDQLLLALKPDSSSCCSCSCGACCASRPATCVQCPRSARGRRSRPTGGRAGRAARAAARRALESDLPAGYARPARRARRLRARGRERRGAPGDPYASSKHSAVLVRDGARVVRDLGSTNGLRRRGAAGGRARAANRRRAAHRRDRAALRGVAMRIAEFATATHAGRVRRKNEDAYYAEAPLFAVADGMGGALAGELASRISVQTLAELVAEGTDEERLAATSGSPTGAWPSARPRIRGPRDGLDGDRRARRPDGRRLCARRRFACLPVAQRGADPPLRRPLAGRRSGSERARSRPRRPRIIRSAR